MISPQHCSGSNISSIHSGLMRSVGVRVGGGSRLLSGYLGDKGAAVGKEAEFLGELKGEVGEGRRGLASRSPLCSFHSSSSFSMDRRLLTLDSFCSVCWSMACSLDNCLQRETESYERAAVIHHTVGGRVSASFKTVNQREGQRSWHWIQTLHMSQTWGILLTNVNVWTENKTHTHHLATQTHTLIHVCLKLLGQSGVFVHPGLEVLVLLLHLLQTLF